MLGRLANGYTLAFAAALLEFAGVPVPGSILLLAIGAVAAGASLWLPGVVIAATVGALIADTMWFQIGRWRGRTLLRAYCRITLGSRSCTERTERVFTRLGPRALAFAKFVPGLSTFAAPFAGLSGTSRARFLFWDVVGSLLWSTTYLVAGGLLGQHALYVWAPYIAAVQSWLFWGLVVIAAAYVAMKVVRRIRRGPAALAADG